MNKGLLITLPNHDDTTAYLEMFSRSIVAEAELRGIKVKELKGENARKEDFEKCVKNLKYKLIVLNGHGSETAVFGHKNVPLVEAGMNDSSIKGSIVYARACHAGNVLGRSMKDDDGCFIGYALPFMFYIDERWHSNPHNNKLASLFLGPSNAIPISIMKGNTANMLTKMEGRKCCET